MIVSECTEVLLWSACLSQLKSGCSVDRYSHSGCQHDQCLVVQRHKHWGSLRNVYRHCQ